MTEEYIASLVDKYGDMVFRIAYTYLKNKDDAEDAVGDLYLKIVDKEPKFNDETHERLWMVRAIINICKNRLKAYWNKNKCSEDSAADFGTLDTYNETPEILSAVLALPPKYKTAIYLFYYEGFKTPEIAQMMHKTESTVRSIIMRAREQLESVLKEGYDFERQI